MLEKIVLNLDETWYSGKSRFFHRGFPDEPKSLVNNPSAIEDAPTQTLVHVAVHTINDTNADPEDFFTPHPGTANFLFVDGSVRPVRTGIGISVLQGLATRNGGEVINPDDY